MLSVTCIIVDSLPSANNVRRRALECFSVLRTSTPLTTSPGLYCVFSIVILKVKSVPLKNSLNIKPAYAECYETKNLKFVINWILLLNFLPN